MIHQKASFALHFNSFLQLFLQCGLGESQEKAYIQVLQCEDHGVCHKHSAGLLGDRSRQDVGVDGEGDVAFAQVPHSPQCGVLGAEELTQVFVENEYQLRHTCNRQ